MKLGLVCEGGGMRGVFTAGVLEVFMEENFYPDEVIGVSAGASNTVSYVAKQKGRCYRTNVDYFGDKRYVSMENLIKTGSMFGMDFLFGELPNKLDPFDRETFFANSCEYYAGATDVMTGKVKFFGKEDMDEAFTPLRASCSLPLVGNVIPYCGRKYMDGGIGDSIPIKKALDDGCDQVILILTRERGYVKKAQKGAFIYKLLYKKYPGLLHAMKNRHIEYNKTLKYIKKLERKGKVIVIAPPQPLPVGRVAKNKDDLLKAYAVGRKMGKKFLENYKSC
ncbi:MAG: patatin family protein [Lachnospiraceae bacterium]|nr:patatin family protein [Lachnospiraceae bacterium]